MKKRTFPPTAAIAALAVLAALGAVESAHAIPFGGFSPANLPSGSAAPPSHGLRLDGLPGEDFFILYFNDSRSKTILNYDDSGLRIRGGSRAGQVDGAGHINGQRFVMDFLYSIGIAETGGGMEDPMIAARHQNGGQNSGWIVAPDQNRQPASGWFLRDHLVRNPASLQIGDEGGTSHREWLGVSGWGWIDWSGGGSGWGGSESGCCSDWLFTVALPEPTTLALFGLGLLFLSGTYQMRMRFSEQPVAQTEGGDLRRTAGIPRNREAGRALRRRGRRAGMKARFT